MKGFVVVAALVLPTVVAAQSDAVPREQIEAQISETLPTYLAPYDFDYRIFALEGAGSGRVSVEGDAQFTQNIVRRFDNFERVLPDLVQQISPGNTADAAALLEAAKWLGLPYHPSYRSELSVYFYYIMAGSTVPFTAEFSYLETVSGVRLTGEPVLQIEPNLKTESQLGSNQIMAGSARLDALIQQVAANANAASETLNEQRAMLVDWMSRDEITFRNGRMGRDEPVFIVQGGFGQLAGLEEGAWYDENLFSVLDVTGTAEFVDGLRLGYQANAQVGDRLPVRLQLAVGAQDQRVGTISIAIHVFQADRWHQLTTMYYDDGMFTSHDDFVLRPPA
jgi:hypothetical protein